LPRVQRLALNILLELELRGGVDMITILRGRKTWLQPPQAGAAF